MQSPTQNIPSIPGVAGLEFFKEEDKEYFGKLLDQEGRGDEEMGIEELKERKIMRVLLKIKNGSPPVRKVFDYLILDCDETNH